MAGLYIKPDDAGCADRKSILRRVGIIRRASVGATLIPAVSVVTRSSLRPLHLRRQTHENRFDIASGLQPEQRPAVVDQIKLHITTAADQLMFALRGRPRLTHPAAHDTREYIKKCLAHVTYERE